MLTKVVKYICIDIWGATAAARAARGEANQNKIKGEIVVHEGEVTLSHTK
jgi:hypothetical protein